ATQKKQNNEAQARALLATIDDYLLTELGITLPQQPAKTWQNQTLMTKFNQVSNNRLDPFFHQTYFKNVQIALENGRYELVRLKDCLEYYKKGTEVGSNEYQYKGIPFVRVTDINDWEIMVDKTSKYISQSLFDELKYDFQPQKDEIVYSKDGTVGFCTVVTKAEDYIVSGGILRLKTNEKVNNWYLKSVLSTSLYKLLAKKISIGAVIQHLTLDYFWNLQIPLPPLPVQERIALHIQNIREQAAALEAEAIAIQAAAKAEIEKMLLGNH
ncbi:MAG: restriction endonuclease subunit S, partial [Cellulosilyticaceae bacterium]